MVWVAAAALASLSVEPIFPKGRRTPAAQTYPPPIRDIETIDSELGLVVAIRRMIRVEEVRTPNARRIDQLLDERAAVERQGSAGTRSPWPASE